MVRAPWGYGLQQRILKASGMVLGKPAGEGESPVGEGGRERAGS